MAEKGVGENVTRGTAGLGIRFGGDNNDGAEASARGGSFHFPAVGWTMMEAVKGQRYVAWMSSDHRSGIV